MTAKDNDRLTALETVVREVDRKVTAMFGKLDGFCDPTEGIFVKLTLQATKNKESIENMKGTFKWIWAVVAPVSAGLILMFIRMLAHKG
jgi:hypothetical protein